MIDPIEALITYLDAQPAVSTLLLGIYDSEVPESQDVIMPAKVAVLLRGGGPPGPRTLQLTDRQVNLRIYGETPHLAETVYNVVYDALKGLTPTIQANTYIHWANHISGPIALRDPKTQWPYIASAWTVRMSTLTIA